MKIRMLFNSGNDQMKPERTGFNCFNRVFNNRVIIALNSIFVITINHKLNSVAIAFIQIENFQLLFSTCTMCTWFPT